MASTASSGSIRPSSSSRSRCSRSELEPELAGEAPRAVAQTGGVPRLTVVEAPVEDRGGELGVVRPRPSVEVVAPHGGPHVVDHADLGVDVDRGAVVVLDVEDLRRGRRRRRARSAGPWRGRGARAAGRGGRPGRGTAGRRRRGAGGAGGAARRRRPGRRRPTTGTGPRRRRGAGLDAAPWRTRGRRCVPRRARTGSRGGAGDRSAAAGPRRCRPRAGPARAAGVGWAAGPRPRSTSGITCHGSRETAAGSSHRSRNTSSTSRTAGPRTWTWTSCHAGRGPYAAAKASVWGSPWWCASSRRPCARSIPPSMATSSAGCDPWRTTTNFWWWLPTARTRWSRSTSPPTSLTPSDRLRFSSLENRIRSR